MIIKQIKDLFEAIQAFRTQDLKADYEKRIQSAIVSERRRIEQIDEIADRLPPDVVKKAKYEDPRTAEELAYDFKMAERERYVAVHLCIPKPDSLLNPN